MSIEREARFLNGTDIGRTVSIGDDNAAELIEVEHDERGCWILTRRPDGRVWNTRLNFTDIITIKGNQP